MTSAFCDSHCHLHISPPTGSAGPVLDDEGLARRELETFAAAGGRMVIDCQPGGAGRDGQVLVRLAESTGVMVAASTGFHLEPYHGTRGRPDPDAGHRLWLSELESGLVEAPEMRARVVKSAWTDGSGDERELITAAARAATEARAGMVVHTERGGEVESLVSVLLEAGVVPGRTQLSHVDKRPDLGLHAELAEAGFLLGYDTFLRPRYEPEKNVWPLLTAMARAGYWDRIAIGFDLVDSRLWSVRGGPGLTALPRQVSPRLEASGFEPGVVSALVCGNGMRLAGMAGDRA